MDTGQDKIGTGWDGHGKMGRDGARRGMKASNKSHLDDCDLAPAHPSLDDNGVLFTLHTSSAVLVFPSVFVMPRGGGGREGE